MTQALGQIAITGAQGQLGRTLTQLLGPAAWPLSHQQLDISQADQVARVLGQHSFSALINTAAYTQVDQAELEPERARQVNAEAVGYLARACQRQGALLVQISTDYVFGGPNPAARPWTEQDTPSPLGVYAQTKWEGERAAQACDLHLIVRTCGLYGHPLRWHQGPNFVDTMLRLARSSQRVRVVDDQWCSPSCAYDVGLAIVGLVAREARGVFHVVNGGAATWHKVAEAVFRRAAPGRTVETISSNEYGARAPRPGYSVLDGSRYAASGAPAMRSWQQALEAYLAAADFSQMG